MTKNMISLKKLVVLVVAFAMAATLFPATADAASTNTSLYRKAKSMQQKLTKNAEYYGYYTEVSLDSNTDKKVVWKMKYTNTENLHFTLTQTTVRKGSQIKTTYKNKGDSKTLTYKGILSSLEDYKTQNGYAMMDKSSLLADTLIEEAEKDGWTVSNVKGHAKTSQGSTTFKATNKKGQVYKVSVARVAVDSKKSVKTVYKLNGEKTTKALVIKGFQKYA